MLAYVVRRLLIFIPMMIAVSIVSFVIIQLPPGSFLENRIAELEFIKGDITDAEIVALKNRYGSDKPLWQQYLIWVKNIVTKGDFGRSFLYDREVKELVWSYLGCHVARIWNQFFVRLLIGDPTWLLGSFSKRQVDRHLD